MAQISLQALIVIFLCMSLTVSQNGGSDFCFWASPSAAVVQDALWIDGGDLYTQSDSETQKVDLAKKGNMYYLNFSSAFNTQTTNLGSLFTARSKVTGTGSNIAPPYTDGMMFANKFDIYFYGGLVDATSEYSSANPKEEILAYSIYGAIGPFDVDMSVGSTSPPTRYIAAGAGVNIPSEMLSYYFGGYEALGGGPVSTVTFDYQLSSSLVEVDMTKSLEIPTFTNYTLHKSVPSRAGAQLVWIPVSSQGMLVVIGGVLYPDDLYDSADNDTQKAENNASDPGFMSTVSLYDIGTKQWFTQQTTSSESGFPDPRTYFCSVVGVANDSSSFNIYIYGGYDGSDSGPSNSPYDDVWILSLPSFTWIQVSGGLPAHGRSSHVCAQPYPNLMFVVGGTFEGEDYKCLEGGVIQVFNLNTLSWQDDYNPTQNFSEYEYLVPDVVTEQIGGNSRGAATKTVDWDDNDLGNLFNVKYSNVIETYYPYAPIETIRPGINIQSDTSHWLAPVVGVIGCLVVLSLAGLLAFCILRRRRRSKASSVEYEIASAGDWGRRNRVGRWLHTTPDTAYHQQYQRNIVAKSEPSVTTTELEESNGRGIPSPGLPGIAVRSEIPYEMDRHHHHPQQQRPGGNAGIPSSEIPYEAAGSNDRVLVNSGSRPPHLQQPSSGSGGSFEVDGTSRYVSQATYTPGQPYELATSYHFPTLSRISHGIDQTVSGSPGHAQPDASEGSTSWARANAENTIANVPDTYVGQGLNPNRISAATDRSSGASPQQVSPEFGSSSPGSMKGSDHANSSHFSSGLIAELGHQRRPAHERHTSSMSSGIAQLPSPGAPLVSHREEVGRSEFLQSVGGSPPRPSYFNEGFGPDGQARTPSVVMRKAIPGPADERYEQVQR